MDEEVPRSEREDDGLEARALQHGDAMSPRAEPIHLVGEEAKRRATPRPNRFDGREEQARGAEFRRPEEECDPAGPQHARELAKEHPPFFRCEVLHDAEVPEPGHRGVAERQPEEVTLEEPTENRNAARGPNGK